MMDHSTEKYKSGIGDLAYEAGFGIRIWSSAGYFAAKYYHAAIAGVVVATLLLAILPYKSVRLIGPILGCYLLYLGGRWLLPQQLHPKFYHPTVQFIRAQIGLWGVFLILWLIPIYERRLDLWPLFLLPLLIISRHHTTPRFNMSVLQAGLLLTLAWWGGRTHEAILTTAFPAWAKLINSCLYLGLTAFISHYLMRNIDARDDIININEAIKTLFDRGTRDQLPAERWQLAFATSLSFVKGACSSLWLCDHNTQQIRPLTDYYSCISADLSDQPARCDRHSVAMKSDHPLARAVRHNVPLFCYAGGETGEPFAGPDETTTCPLASGIHSRIIIPITEVKMGRLQTIGLLCIDFKRKHSPRQHIRGEYFDYLSGLAQRIRPLLYHIQQLEELQALRLMGQQISSNLTRHQVLENALDAVVDTLGFQFGAISLVDPAAGVIRMEAGRHVSPAWIKAAVHPLDSQDILADVVRTGRQEVLTRWDARFDESIWKQFNHKEMIRAFTPITGTDHTGQERVLGVIEAGYSTAVRAEISDEQRDMLSTFAQQLFMAIENAVLYEKTEHRAESLASLHKIGWEVALGHDLPHVIKKVGHTIKDVLSADVVIIYRYNRQSQQFEAPDIFGQIEGKRHLHIPSATEGPIATILNTHRPRYIPDVKNDTFFSHEPVAEGGPPLEGHRSFSERQRIVSFAGIPMLASGEAVGVLCINYRQGHEFSDNECQVLEIAAQFAAVALHNAEMSEYHEEMITARERSRLATRLHDSISQYLPAIRFKAETAQVDLNGSEPKVTQHLDHIRNISLKVIKEVRGNIFELNTGGLPKTNLEQSLDEYVQEARDYFKLEIDLRVKIEPTAPTPPLVVTRELLMICREGIANVAKHAETNRMKLVLCITSQKIILQMEDPGCGFQADRGIKHSRHGLNMMYTRVNHLNGSLALQSQPGRGTAITIEVPQIEEGEWLCV